MLRLLFRFFQTELIAVGDDENERVIVTIRGCVIFMIILSLIAAFTFLCMYLKIEIEFFFLQMYSQVRDPPKLNSDNGSANALVEENDNGIPVGDFSLSSLLELDFEPFSSLQEENGNPLLGLQNSSTESHDAQ